MRKAMAAIGARTKKETIVSGLSLLIKTKQKNIFRRELATFNLDLDLDILESMRNDK
jgi:hypothetical protein